MPRRAGVSSFGISGTNAHVILEQAPDGRTAGDGAGTAPLAGDVVPWVVSAQRCGALRAQAARLADGLAANADCRTWRRRCGCGAGRPRPVFEHRAVVVGADRDDLLAGLEALAAGEPVGGVVTRARSAPGARGRVRVPGAGWRSGWGWAVSCWRAVAGVRRRDWRSVRRRWRRGGLVVGGGAVAVRTGWLERVDVVQPVLWAVMVSLAEVWRVVRCGPAAVVGHSQGEIAAAVVAGALSLEDGARVVALRSPALAGVGRSRGRWSSVALAPERGARSCCARAAG